MFHLFIKIALFIYLIYACDGVLLECAYRHDKKLFTSFHKSVYSGVISLNISQSEIKSDPLYERFGVNTIRVTVNTYIRTDPQLKLISNLPECVSIALSSTGQRVIPVFKNLPVIKRISIDSNFLTYVKKETFNSLGVQTINLDKNSIFVIEDQSFGLKVHRLTLRCNKIDKFSKKWFQNLTSLEEIFLTGNEISAIEENQFKDFSNLKRIFLDENFIFEIGNGAFGNRNKFTTINLNYNQLKQFSLSVFNSGIIEIETFGITENLLTFLTEEFMKKVKVTYSAGMNGNPWQCKCYDKIREWIAWDVWKAGPDDQARCVSPVRSSSFSNNCIPHIDQEIIDFYLQHDRDKDPVVQKYCGLYHSVKV